MGTIGEYFDLPSDVFDGVRSVINCTGIVRGNGDELRRVNCDLQHSLAEKARSAGVAMPAM